MNLNPDDPSSGQNRITGYGDNFVLVNELRFEKSVVVLADRIVDDWGARGFDELVADHFEFLRRLAPEIVLLGTGNTLRFPSPRLSQPLIDAQIGLEVMDTRAACRTYNILTAERRRVAAALLIGP